MRYLRLLNTLTRKEVKPPSLGTLKIQTNHYKACHEVAFPRWWCLTHEWVVEGSIWVATSRSIYNPSLIPSLGKHISSGSVQRDGMGEGTRGEWRASSPHSTGFSSMGLSLAPHSGCFNTEEKKMLCHLTQDGVVARLNVWGATTLCSRLQCPEKELGPAAWDGSI